MSGRPRLLLVGRTRYRLPLSESLRAKFDVARRAARPSRAGQRGRRRGETRRDVRAGGPYRPRKLDGALYFLGAAAPYAPRAAPFAPRRRARPGRARDAGSSCSGGSLAGVRAPVILDVHGDWRSSDAALRLAGAAAAQPARRPRSPSPRVRRADAVRTISDYTTGLVRSHGVEPAAVFPAFMDLEPFLEPRRAAARGSRARSSSACSSTTRTSTSSPRPGAIVAPQAARRDARTSSAGARAGRSSSGSSRDLPGRIGVDRGAPDRGRRARRSTTPRCSSCRRAREGMGRVLVEAFCRGRRRRRRRVGGILDLVERRRERPARRRRRTRRRWPTRSSACSRDRGARRAARRRRAPPARTPGWPAPEEYAARLEALVAALR